MSNKRISIWEKEPEALKAMLQLEAFGKQCNIDPILKEIIKIRASQLNGCAYCLDMHTEDAMKIGESARRIFAISTWHESHLFNETERIILQLTEEVTKIGEHGVSNETYTKAIQLLGENTFAQVVILIITINAWNRAGVTSKSIYKQ